MLGLLMPSFIKKRMNQGEIFIQEDQGELSILFCDICHFDEMVHIEKDQIVILLDKLFRQFDNQCSLNNVQKIETVGKTYMAAAGLKDQEGEQTKICTQRLFELACSMREVAKNMKYDNGSKSIEIKIGIHFGRVMAGVIGHHKPQFSLIGDTVNTTSRVCSTADAGTLTLSDQAYKRLNVTNYQFEKKIVEAKGKGELVTYRLIDESIKIISKASNKLQGINKSPARSIFQLKQEEKMEKTQKIILERRNSSQIKSPFYLSPMKRFSDQNAELKESSSQSNQSIFQKASVNSRQSITQKQQQYLQKIALLERITPSPKKKIEKLGSIVSIDQPNQTVLQIPIFQNILSAQKPILLKQKSVQLQTSQKTIFSNFKAQYQIFEESMASNLINESEKQKLSKSSNFLFGTLFVYTLLSCSVEFLVFQNKIASLILRLIQIILVPFKSRISILFMIISGVRFILTPELYFLLEINIFLFIFTKFEIKYLKKIIYVLINNVFILIGIIFCQKTLILDMLLLSISSQFVNIVQDHKKMTIFNRQLQNQMQLLEQKEKEKSILTYLLPAHIQARFLSQQTHQDDLIETLEEATILFADIAGFTKYSSSVEPEQVVRMLRSLFTQFDESCLTFGVYKLYTIGDCYVVMGVNNANERNYAEEVIFSIMLNIKAFNVILMGFRMIEIIEKVKLMINFDELNMRIGVHTGKIIGGVIGTDIVRYDIYGEDVAIANKMESKGQIGKIMVSEQTKQLLEQEYDCFCFEFHTSVYIEYSNRTVNGYFVDRYDDEEFSPEEEQK